MAVISRRINNTGVADRDPGPSTDPYEPGESSLDPPPQNLDIQEENTFEGQQNIFTSIFTKGVAEQVYAHTVDMGYELDLAQVLDLVRGQPWTREDHRSWRPPGEYISEIIEEIIRGALSRASPGDAERDQE